MFGPRVSAALGVALVTLLAGCGGGSSSTGTSAGGVVSVTPAPTPTPTFTEGDAARLAKQASFGPTPALVARIKELGVNGWLDEQFAATGSTYSDLAVEVRRDFCTSGDTVCTRQHFSRTPAAMRFYADAVMAPDQLRQRVAFALGQMVVASEAEVNSAAGIAAFNQIFLDNAFGNFRDVLVRATMLGYMPPQRANRLLVASQP